MTADRPLQGTLTVHDVKVHLHVIASFYQRLTNYCDILFAFLVNTGPLKEVFS